MGEDKDIVEQVQEEARGREEGGVPSRPEPEDTTAAGTAAPEHEQP